MGYSLELIAQRLRARGLAAYVADGRGAPAGGSAAASAASSVRVAAVRILPADCDPLEAGALYVCDRAPRRCPPGEGFALALAQDPPEGWGAPCLVVPDAGCSAALLNAVAAAKDELDAALARAASLAWEPDGLLRIVEDLSRLLGNPVYVVDSSFKVMAITHDPDMEEMSVNWMHAARRGYLSYDLVAGLIRSDELHGIESAACATLVHSDYFYTPFANCNLRQGGTVAGHLFAVQMYGDIERGHLEAIDLFAPFVLRALQANPSFQASRGPLYEHFVVDWLEGGIADESYIRRQLDALGFDAAAHAVAAVLRMSEAGDFRREHLARLLEDRRGCRVVTVGGRVVALFQLANRGQKEQVLRTVRGICRSQRCRAAVSDVQDGFLDAPRAYRQALQALRICDAMGRDDDVVSYGDVAAYQPYLNFSSTEELDTFLHPAVLALRAHDQAHAVQLLPTLSAFLKHDRDVQATADAIYVHRNTLAYRMRKILELCPVDLDDFEVRHRLLESILVVESYDGIAAHLQGRRP